MIGPGSVATPIWDKAEQADISMYADREYVESPKRAQEYMIRNRTTRYPPEKVGEVTWQALTTSKPRTRYAVVPNNFLRRLIPMFLTRRVMDRLIARNLGFK